MTSHSGKKVALPVFVKQIMIQKSTDMIAILSKAALRNECIKHCFLINGQPEKLWIEYGLANKGLKLQTSI